MRKALVVGLNHYDRYPALTGSIHDAEVMAELLSYHEGVNGNKERNFHVELLTSVELYPDKKITRTKLREKIIQLLDDEDSDVALFFFSGHGFESDLGGYLVTQDARHLDEGVPVADVLTAANRSKVKDIVIILDCCHSGQMGSVAAMGNKQALLRKGVSILTSSGAHQVSLERVRRGGIFTNIISNALEGGAADILGNVKTTHLYEHADDLLGPWDQRPSLKSNVSKVVTLRKTQPKVPQKVLAQLTNWFIVAKNHHKLNRTYLKGEPTADPERVNYFEQFELLYRFGLAEPHGAPTLREAALLEPGGACKLTGKGQFYWEMVKNKRI